MDERWVKLQLIMVKWNLPEPSPDEQLQRQSQIKLAIPPASYQGSEKQIQPENLPLSIISRIYLVVLALTANITVSLDISRDKL